MGWKTYGTCGRDWKALKTENLSKMHLLNVSLDSRLLENTFNHYMEDYGYKYNQKLAHFTTNLTSRGYWSTVFMPVRIPTSCPFCTAICYKNNLNPNSKRRICRFEQIFGECNWFVFAWKYRFSHKRKGADLLEFAAPGIADVPSGRWKFKTVAKSVEKHIRRKEIVSGSKQRRIFPTKITTETSRSCLGVLTNFSRWPCYLNFFFR